MRLPDGLLFIGEAEAGDRGAILYTVMSAVDSKPASEGRFKTSHSGLGFSNQDWLVVARQ